MLDYDYSFLDISLWLCNSNTFLTFLSQEKYSCLQKAAYHYSKSLLYTIYKTMDYRHPLTTNITKIIGSLMALFFSLLAFAYGQNCTLLPGRNPSILIDGQSKTGYQVAEATFTQSCVGSAGTITCISGSVAYGNIFKYPSCIPHTWANCATPTGANHLEYRTLYKA
jgi:hypothetical protein